MSLLASLYIKATLSCEVHGYINSVQHNKQLTPPYWFEKLVHVIDTDGLTFKELLGELNLLLLLQHSSSFSLSAFLCASRSPSNGIMHLGKP